MKRLPCIMLLAMLFAGCSKKNDDTTPAPTPVPPVVTSDIPSDLSSVKTLLADKNATDQTAALFYNLKLSAKTNVLFGHQDDTKQGYTWSNSQGEPYSASTRSDVFDVTGAYPMVYGHDFLQFVGFRPNEPWFINEGIVAKQLTIEAYNRGGINTYSWHYDNPVSKGDFYWANSPVEAVSRILPGGTHNDTFKLSLKKLALFVDALVGADGKKVPIIFRPFHEFDGSWFSWGKDHCTAQQYKDLYKFTVTYLRDSLQVHNILYAWSPDKNFTSEATYLERYPGDEYVDLVGSDNYGDLEATVAPAVAANKYKLISDYAIAHKKLAAMTETGLANISKTDWYTQNLLKVLKLNNTQLCYALVWSNARGYNGNPGTFWTPYPGAPAATINDFIAFKNDPFIVFSNDNTTNFYRIP